MKRSDSLQRPTLRPLFSFYLQPRLKQEGNVQDDQGLPSPRCPLHEAIPVTRHQWVDSCLQPCEGSRVAQHAPPQGSPVDSPRGRVNDGGGAASVAGKEASDGGDGGTPWGVELVDGLVGIPHGDPLGSEHGRDGALAHADGAGEAHQKGAAAGPRRRRHLKRG